MTELELVTDECKRAVKGRDTALAWPAMLMVLTGAGILAAIDWITGGN